MSEPITTRLNAFILPYGISSEKDGLLPLLIQVLKSAQS